MAPSHLRRLTGRALAAGVTGSESESDCHDERRSSGTVIVTVTLHRDASDSEFGRAALSVTCRRVGVDNSRTGPNWAASNIAEMSTADKQEKPSLPADYKVPDVWTFVEQGGAMGAMNRPTAGARFEKALQVGKHPIQLYSLGTPNGQVMYYESILWPTVKF